MYVRKILYFKKISQRKKTISFNDSKSFPKNIFLQVSIIENCIKIMENSNDHAKKEDLGEEKLSSNVPEKIIKGHFVSFDFPTFDPFSFVFSYYFAEGIVWVSQIKRITSE